MSIRDDVLNHLKMAGPLKTSEVSDALALEGVQAPNALQQLKGLGLVALDPVTRQWSATDGAAPTARKPRQPRETKEPVAPVKGGTPRHFDIVIAELRKKRDAIDQAIAGLEELQS